jgi:hypothetical protein
MAQLYQVASSALTQTTTHEPHSTDETFRFLDLPYELRQMVIIQTLHSSASRAITRENAVLPAHELHPLHATLRSVSSLPDNFQELYMAHTVFYFEDGEAMKLFSGTAVAAVVPLAASKPALEIEAAVRMDVVRGVRKICVRYAYDKCPTRDWPHLSMSCFPRLEEVTFLLDEECSTCWEWYDSWWWNITDTFREAMAGRRMKVVIMCGEKMMASWTL